MQPSPTLCTAFEGPRCIASGPLLAVAPLAKAAVDRTASDPQPLAVLVFDDASSEVVELDWRGTPQAFLARLQAQIASTAQPAMPVEDAPAAVAPRGPGRPSLGVVAREVTLLPRHWDWLGQQSGGASVALRKLVETARRAQEAQDRVRQTRAVGYKFMSTMAGHAPGFEEASRALFAGDRAAFEAHTVAWPTDVRTHLIQLLASAFATP